MRKKILSLATAIVLLATGATAQPADTAELNIALSKVGVAAIEMAATADDRNAAAAAVDAAKADFTTAKAAITEASDSLVRFPNISESAKDPFRNRILEQTPIMIAAERQLDTAEAALAVVAAELDAKVSDYHAAKQAVVDLHESVLLEEMNNGQDQLYEAETVSRVLALDLINVCNDNIPEADPERCDPYENQIFSWKVIDAVKSTAD